MSNYLIGKLLKIANHVNVGIADALVRQFSRDRDNMASPLTLVSPITILCQALAVINKIFQISILMVTNVVQQILKVTANKGGTQHK